MSLQQVAETKAQEISQLSGPEEYKAMTQLRRQNQALYDLVVLYKNKYKPRGSEMASLPTVSLGGGGR